MDALARLAEAIFGRPLSPEIATILIVAALVLLHGAVRLVVGRVVESTARRFYWQRGTGTVLVLLGGILIFRLWIPDTHQVLTALGLVAAGLVVVLKDLILDAVASVVIVWRHLFLFGDRTRDGSHRGDIIDMTLFYFTLLEVEGEDGAEQSTGRVTRVPNAIVLNEAV